MPKKILFMLVVLSLNSCNFFSNGPYRNKILDNLGSCKDIGFRDNFSYSCSITCNQEYFNLEMIYNTETKDFIAKDFTYSGHEKAKDTDENISIAENFLNTYFFLTKEKLENLFPANDSNLSFGNRMLTTKEIEIYRYTTDLDRENKTYFLYHYTLVTNYLCLKTFNYFENGEYSFNYDLHFQR